MRTIWLLLLPAVGLLLGMASTAMSAEQDKNAPRAGWVGVFPDLNGYQRTFLAPAVAADKKPVYQQIARYEWTGGAIKMLDVIAARDPAFKQKYAADTVRKDNPPPKEVTIGKRKAWLWTLAKEGEGGTDKPVARLVIPLGDDKALILVAKGAGPWGPLTDLADKFDLAKIETALADPPRTSFLRNLDEFRALKKGNAYADLLAWLDSPDQALPGGATYFLIYRLPDGSQVMLRLDYDSKDASVPGKLRDMVHRKKDGQSEELIK